MTHFPRNPFSLINQFPSALISLPFQALIKLFKYSLIGNFDFLVPLCFLYNPELEPVPGIEAKKKKVPYNILLWLHVFFLSCASIFFCAVLSHCHFPQRLLQLFTTLSYLCSYSQETPLPLSSPQTQSDQVGITSLSNSSSLHSHNHLISIFPYLFSPIPETVSQSLISN